MLLIAVRLAVPLAYSSTALILVLILILVIKIPPELISNSGGTRHMPCLLLSELLNITKRVYNELRLLDDKLIWMAYSKVRRLDE